MVQTQQTLRSFIIPLQSGQAILPNSLMVEVLPFATPLKVENAPAWIAGIMLWRSRNVPLVSLERLVYEITPRTEVHTRIIIINALLGDPRLPYFGLLSEDAPRLINLERTEIDLEQPTQPQSPKLGLLNWVRIREQAAFIPDMDAIEAVLGPLMQHHN
jgi:chemosensory pili system protein ChpC